MRPARKAREGRIPGVCNRRATPRPGMQRRPNVTGLRGRDTRPSGQGAWCRRFRSRPILADLTRDAIVRILLGALSGSVQRQLNDNVTVEVEVGEFAVHVRNYPTPLDCCSRVVLVGSA